MAKMKQQKRSFDVKQIFNKVTSLFRRNRKQEAEAKTPPAQKYFHRSSGRPYGFRRSFLLSRDYRSRNKFNPGNFSTFSRGQIRDLRGR
jgi:hypothetical protein